MRNATLTAATLLALKLAWRKFFALLALGRRAEDMATTLPARHAVRSLLRQAARRRRASIAIRRRCCAARSIGALAESERAALVTAFRDGGRVLGRSVLEAPAWMSARVERAARALGRERRPTADPGDVADVEPATARRRAGSIAPSAAVEARLAASSRAICARWSARSSGAGKRLSRRAPEQSPAAGRQPRR